MTSILNPAPQLSSQLIVLTVLQYSLENKRCLQFKKQLNILKTTPKRNECFVVKEKKDERLKSYFSRLPPPLVEEKEHLRCNYYFSRIFFGYISGFVCGWFGYASDILTNPEIVPRTLIPGNHVNLLQGELNLSLHYRVLPTFTLTHHVEPFIPSRIVPEH